MISVLHVFYEIAAFFSPSFCALCGEPVSFKRNGVCERCEAALEIHTHFSCPVCAGSSMQRPCPDCSGRTLYYERNISLYRYEGAAEKLVHALKFSGRRDIAPFIAKHGAELVSAQHLNADIITYIPAVRSRERKRGYNQSKIVAQKIGVSLCLPVQNLLSARKTGDQKKKHFNERFLNIIGRFDSVKRADISGKMILIVDDVFTTGATINEAARILKKMGAESVFSLTIARVAVKKS